MHANLRRVEKGIEEQVIAFEDMFIDMGEFAADLYEQAENEVGELEDELIALGDAVMKEMLMVGAEIDALLQKMEDWAEKAIENLEMIMNAVGDELRQLGDDINDSAAAQELRILLMAFN